MKRISRSTNRHASKLLLLGLAGVAGHNWRLWYRHKAVLAQQIKGEPLAPMDAWAEDPPCTEYEYIPARRPYDESNNDLVGRALDRAAEFDWEKTARATLQVLGAAAGG